MLKTHSRVRLLLEACLAAQQPFVVDNTNMRRSQRAGFIAPPKAAGFRVIGYYFPCELRDAIRRNLQRSEGRIPPAAVGATRKQLEVPALAEGFDELHMVTTHEGHFTVQPWATDENLEPTATDGGQTS